MNNKNKRLLPARCILFVSSFILTLFFVENAYAGGIKQARGTVYASNPIVYAIYINLQKKPLTKRAVITYIKIVNPAKYAHDRFNSFLWHNLYTKDKARFKKLLNYVSSVQYFEGYINARLGHYNHEKNGFYLRYYRSKRIIKNGMRTHRDINFIKTENGNIYYMFHNLTIVHENSGNFNFIRVNPKMAEKFLNSRTGTFGHVRRNIFLVYYYKPIKASKGVLTVKIIRLFVYNNKHKSFLLGSI